MIEQARVFAIGANDYFREWVHPDVRGDAVLKARHSSLIASHMLGGIVSAFVFAGYFAWTGAPGVAAMVAAACFLSPIAIAVFLSRTGRLEIAHLLSAAQLAALVTLAAALSGGTQSFALVWLAIVPLEAALSTDRRMMIIATALAVAALAGLHVAAGADWLPDPVQLPISTQGAAFAACLGAVAYAGAIAANVQQIHRGAARELEASRESYRLIAENANDLITRHEADGTISFASLASHPLLGLAPDALMARGFQARLATADHARYLTAIQHCFDSGAPAAEAFCLASIDSAPADAPPTWVEMRCQRVDATGTGQGRRTVVVVTRDITRAKAEATALALAREEADRANRAKTAFLATMSHELRTPLSAIIGFAEILHRELLIKAREPKHADYCRIIHQSGEHLLSLVKDLLDVSRIESGHLSIEPEPFALDEVAVAAIETLRPQADSKGLKLVTKLDPALPDLLADRRATKQILINLVSNAVKFTDTGGTVSVYATAVGDHIEITVADDGIGIEPDDLARIVQPFYQVETSYARQNEGVGLGLSIVRGLIDLHGGTLRIESEPGSGSRFIVRLPADVPGEAGATASATAAAALPPHIIDLAQIHAEHQSIANPAPSLAAAEIKPRAVVNG
ncbi:MAG: ATP-binding protein [Hyphomicrobiaceae bacterium]